MVSVVVLPLPPENDGSLLPESELEVSFQRGSGPGGQHRNKVETAVRMTHKPTGIQILLDGGRSQSQNRAVARRILSAKVNERANAQQKASYDQARRDQVDGGGRGNKIRTYNLLESRAVDHRTNKKTTEVQQVIGKGRFDLLL
jgi:peptide chain release factor 1